MKKTVWYIELGEDCLEIGSEEVKTKVENDKDPEE